MGDEKIQTVHRISLIYKPQTHTFGTKSTNWSQPVSDSVWGLWGGWWPPGTREISVFLVHGRPLGQRLSRFSGCCTGPNAGQVRFLALGQIGNRYSPAVRDRSWLSGIEHADIPKRETASSSNHRIMGGCARTRTVGACTLITVGWIGLVILRTREDRYRYDWVLEL